VKFGCSLSCTVVVENFSGVTSGRRTCTFSRARGC